MKCHMCGSETDWYCRDCDRPVCEDCVVEMTYHNQIDYTKCQDCDDNHQAQDYLDRALEWKKEEAAQTKKDVLNKARRIAYWKPKAVKKRRIAKELRQREKAELYEKQMKEAVKIVSEIFRGMF